MSMTLVSDQSTSAASTVSTGERPCLRCEKAITLGSPEEMDFRKLPGGALIHHTAGYMLTPQGAIYCVECVNDGVETCRGCGCTDEAGCRGGCYWAGPGYCSACVRKEERQS